MSHNRKLVLSGVSLTKARPNKCGIEVMGETRDEFEKLFSTSGYLDNAPFTWVGLTLRYGIKHENIPHYQRIDKKDGELPLAIELDTRELISADRAELKRQFVLATLKALIHAGKKFQRPVKALEEMLNSFTKKNSE